MEGQFVKTQVVTIGDAMKDIFIFPDTTEMEKPISKHHEKFLTLGYGEKITVADSYQDVGGTACNVAVGLAKMGIKTSLISAVGKDLEGKEIMERLEKFNVHTDLLKENPKKKTSFSIIISYRGERSILVFHSFVPADFNIPDNLDADWIYVGPLGENYRALFAKLIPLASEKNIKIAINPGAVQIHDGLLAFGGLLPVTKILFLNKEEAQILAGLTGVATVKEIVYVLKKTGAQTIVITCGKEGAYAAQGKEFFKIGIYPSHLLEATGAGDAFASSFLAGIINKEDLFTCLKWGVTNSASVIESYGAQQGLLNIATIKRRVKEYRWPASTLRFS
jgi:ribokinase